MQATRFALIFLIVSSVFTTSCKNLFSELANPDGDEALFYEAQRQSDSKQYDNAITLINTLSASYLAKREVQVFLASAYAGRCGLDYLVLADSAINNPSNFPIMQLALSHMKTTTSFADCKQAETILRAVSPARDGIMSDNVDDAFLMAFVSLAKVGAILEKDADTGAGNPSHDGAIDAGFDACTLVGNPDAVELSTGLTLIYNNLKSVNTTFASKMATLTTVCNTIGGTTCANTNGAAFTNNELKSIMGVVNYKSFGVGSQVAYTPCP